MGTAVRILFLADSHIGFDLPLTARSGRRRRGWDFLGNHEAALSRALLGDIDVVVHGGDVFDRPDVSAGAAWQAYAPLVRVAQAGVPVVIVPGNHERSRLPHAHLLAHPGIHIFHAPGTVSLDVRGVRVALSGFPYERRDVRTRFAELVDATEWRRQPADVRLLCVHHCVEGATVGPSDYTFTSAADVIRIGDVPREFSALLSGHIHRQQVLTRDLAGRAVDVPVLYPGSVERTALAEMGEPKGYLLLDCDGAGGVRHEFCPLPARPMLVERVAATEDAAAFAASVRGAVQRAPEDAVLVLRIAGSPSEEQLRVLRAASLRSFVPATMNVEVQFDRAAAGRRGLQFDRAAAGRRGPQPNRGGAKPRDQTGAPSAPESSSQTQLLLPV